MTGKVRARYHRASFQPLRYPNRTMRLLLLCCVAAVATVGCTTISTDLDPGGSPKYRAANRGTGTNIARRADAADMPVTKALGQDDVDRLMRPGGSGPRPGQN